MGNRTARRLTTLALTLAAALALIAVGAWMLPGSDGASAALQNDTGSRRLVFREANQTPIAASGTSVPVCGLSEYDEFIAEVRLTGTMTGTNPTLAITWQSAIGPNDTYTTIDTFTTINATVTPAAQTHALTELPGAVSTAVVYGDCMKMAWTIGGTDSPSALIDIVGHAE